MLQWENMVTIMALNLPFLTCVFFVQIPMSEQDKQMLEMHERLLARGVNVSAKTLAR